jgi:hypothetical protein
MTSHTLFATLALSTLSLLACSDHAGSNLGPTGEDAKPRRLYHPQTALPWAECPEDPTPLEDAVVLTAFDRAEQYFAAEDNRRTIEAEVEFPSGDWARIDLRIELTCPAQGECDHWDRSAALFLVDGPKESDERLFELERYITPYGVPLCLTTDVTAFSTLLAGRKSLRSTIDTWVGPGSTEYGNGWRTTVTFVLHPGGEPNGANEVLPVLTDVSVPLGDPATAQESQRTVFIPGDARKVQMRVLVTGHGQGNLSNCGEFCELDRAVEVNGQPFSQAVWRKDCASNPLDTQRGSWSAGPRAGWCPGAYVVPGIVNITEAVRPGEPNTFLYVARELTSREPYVNSCRPGQGGATNTCAGCAFNQQSGNCDYDGAMHTPPVDRVSVMLLIYR